MYPLPKITRCSCAVVQSRQHKPSFPHCKVELWCLWYRPCCCLWESKAEILILSEGLRCIAQRRRGSCWCATSVEGEPGWWAPETELWACTGFAGSGSRQLWWRLLKCCSKSQMSFVPLAVLTAPHPTWPVCMEGSEQTALPRWLEPLAGSLCFESEMWIWEQLLSLALP